jgi:hypothetical protein
MRLRPSTIVAALLLTIWFALDFVGVGKLVDREPILSLAGIMLALMGAFLVSGFRRLPWVAPVYALALAIWGALQVQTHWSTYFAPASEAKLRWYGRVFGDHWRLLPELPTRTVPDAYHTILAVLIVVNLALALRDIWRPAGRRPLHADPPGRQPAR